MRQAISAEERLAVTLRYLATGDNFRSLRYVFKMSDSTISEIVHETCIAIYTQLREEYLKVSVCFLSFLRICIYSTNVYYILVNLIINNLDAIHTRRMEAH